MVMNIRVDEEFKRKLEYLQRINGYKSKSDTIRKTVEKEYIKETNPILPMPYQETIELPKLVHMEDIPTETRIIEDDSDMVDVTLVYEDKRVWFTCLLESERERTAEMISRHGLPIKVERREYNHREIESVQDQMTKGIVRRNGKLVRVGSAQEKKHRPCKDTDDEGRTNDIQS